MNIQFYIPKSQTIPTQLRVLVDGHHVYYDPVPDGFGYDFQFFSNETEEEAMKIVDELASIMCSQSYDHGSQWRVVSKEVVQQEERYRCGVIIRVMFRVRDSY